MLGTCTWELLHLWEIQGLRLKAIKHAGFLALGLSHHRVLARCVHWVRASWGRHTCRSRSGPLSRRNGHPRQAQDITENVTLAPVKEKKNEYAAALPAVQWTPQGIWGARGPARKGPAALRRPQRGPSKPARGGSNQVEKFKFRASSMCQNV